VPSDRAHALVIRDFTFVCPTEIIAFSDEVAKFKALGCEVLGASIDSEYTHFAWCQTPRKQGGLGAINYPLIADVDRSVSTKYGALLGNTGYTLRATYVIDAKGILRHLSMNDPPVGRNISELVRLVSGYQYVEKHGEVCPAGWQKDGDATIKDDPVKKLDFFNKAF